MLCLFRYACRSLPGAHPGHPLQEPQQPLQFLQSQPQIMDFPAFLLRIIPRMINATIARSMIATKVVPNIVSILSLLSPVIHRSFLSS